jgi:hypothetical protein
MFFIEVEQTYVTHRPYRLRLRFQLPGWLKQATLYLVGLAILGTAYYAIAAMLVDAGAK